MAHRRTRLPLSLLSAALVVGALTLSSSRASTTPAIENPPQIALDIRVSISPTPVTIAGTPQLVYELYLTNFRADALVLEGVEVLDATRATPAPLAQVSGDALEARLYRPAASSDGGGPRTMPGGTHAVLYLEVGVEAGPAPQALRHRIAYRPQGRDVQEPLIASGGEVAVNEGSAVVLAPPLRGGPWAAVYHPTWERGHRRVVYATEGRARIPGRFAVDWFLLDADGRRARGDENVVANWLGHGAEVLAVAEAVVVAVRDDIEESATLSGNPDHSLEDGTGNYVALDLGDGRYATYEHLRPGSIRVVPGDRVLSGQVIAELGFTGHSSGPHLHFHVADANSPLGAEGLPFALEGFRVLGAYGQDLASFGKGPWQALPDVTSGWRTEELPAANVVVEFEPHTASSGEG